MLWRMLLSWFLSMPLRIFFVHFTLNPTCHMARCLLWTEMMSSNISSSIHDHKSNFIVFWTFRKDLECVWLQFIHNHPRLGRKRIHNTCIQFWILNASYIIKLLNSVLNTESLTYYALVSMVRGFMQNTWSRCIVYWQNGSSKILDPDALSTGKMVLVKYLIKMHDEFPGTNSQNKFPIVNSV